MSYANANLDSLVFHHPATDIPKLAMKSFRKVAKRLSEIFDVSSANVMDINTRQKNGAIFVKMLALWDESGIDVILDEDYLLRVLYCVLNPNTFSDDDWDNLTYRLLPIRSTYRVSLVQGFSFALLDMHLNRFITLPWNYSWPFGAALAGAKLDIQRGVLFNDNDLPELFRQVRSVYDEDNPHYADYGYYQRSRTVSVATKLLTALGWQDIAEANYEDLEAVYRMGLDERVVTIRPSYLLKLLENIYGNHRLRWAGGSLLRQRDRCSARRKGATGGGGDSWAFGRRDP